MASPRLPVIASGSTDAVMQTLTWMRKNDFRPVPLHPQSKAAISRDYAAIDYKPPGDDLWRTRSLGVGCVTGPRHHGPVDLDLDCEEAIFFADRFLPPTAAVFGRASKLRSHRLYIVDAASFEKQAFLDPIDANSCIVEARGDQGHQTVMPGSVHEATGELIEWSDVPFPDVPHVQADVLMLGARKIALATLISRHIWAPGYHNEPVKHITGMLFYLQWTEQEVVDLLSAVMEYHDDNDKSRVPTIRATFKRGEAGKKISGAGVLRKQLKNDDLVDRLLDLAGSPTINLLTEYNEVFAAVNVRGKFRIADFRAPQGEPPTFLQKDDFLNLTATDYSSVADDKGRPIPKSKLWLANSNRRAYHRVDFLPGLTADTHDDNNVMNLWTGWGLDTTADAPADGCDAWLDLLHDVICGGDDRKAEWLLHWFANIVRDPMEKSLTAPVLIGVEGAGKSLLLGYFGRILGRAYTVITKEQHIYGQFNAHLGSTLLLHSEEALYGGDRKHAGIIRSLITDEWSIFEQKGIDAFQVRNYLRLVLTSNEAHAAPAKPGDRRYSVYDIGERKLTIKLRDRVLREMKSTGPLALFHYLMNMDYDPDIARNNLKDDSLLALKAINLPPLETWWYSVLTNGCVLPDYLSWATKPEKDDWPDCVSSTALYVAMTIKMREMGVRTIPNETYLSFQLNRFVNVKLQRAQRNYDNPLIDEAPSIVNQMSARQSSIVNMPPLAVCRKAFEKHLGQKIEWPLDDDTKKSKPEKKDVEY